MSQFGASEIHRSFGPTLALRGVSLGVERGQIRALLGGNGSGKSTLVKILAGVLPADSGDIIDRGQAIPTRAWSAHQARASGFHVVHQHAGVFPDLSVSDNLAIGRGFEQTRYGRIKPRDQRRRAAGVLDRFGIDVLPDTPMRELRAADRMMVAIARALQDQEDSREGLLILDEPTAALPSQEVDALLAALRRYAAAGQAIVYISHRLDEVLEIADQITVLRDGEVVSDRPIAGLTEGSLVDLIVGARVEAAVREGPAPDRSAGPVLEIHGLHGPGVDGVDLRVHPGEAVGIAGVLGSGRTELLKLIYGAARPTSGTVALGGTPLHVRAPRDAIDAGVALVPEDRATEAAFLDQTVRHNLSAARVSAYWNKLLLRKRHEQADAVAALDRYQVSAPSALAPMAALSGGNQQKVIFARWLETHPRLLLLDEPTQGVDAEAREQLYRLVNDATARGAAALIVASDLEELARVCDRAIVMVRGRVAAEVSGEDLTADRLTTLAHEMESHAA